MKAVILAGGKGTRGKPYTDYFPKAMIPIMGRPLIDYIVRYLSSYSFIDEIIIVTDFKGLGGQIKNYFENSSIKKISFIQDSQSGTAGDLLHLKSRLKNSKEFVLWFVDNFCAVDLKKMVSTFRAQKSLACIATRSKRKEETGYAIVKNGIIKEFREKPIIKLKMAECLGIYVLSTQIFKKIKPKNEATNLSFDILQDLSKQGAVSSFDIENKEWLDVESPLIVERNEIAIRKIIKQMG